MNHCKKCNVSILGTRKHCPLCQRKLEQSNQSLSETTEIEHFPIIPTYFQKFLLFFKILTFLSIATGIICLLIDFLIPGKIHWSLLVIAGIAYVWITLVTAFRKLDNICKNILYQMIFSSIIIMVIDGLTGWHGWSVDFVIPSLCICSILSIAIVAKIMGFGAQQYAIYLIINAFLCLLPLVLMWFGIVHHILLSLISIAINLLVLIFFAIFMGIHIKSELKRRLHL